MRELRHDQDESDHIRLFNIFSLLKLLDLFRDDRGVYKKQACPTRILFCMHCTMSLHVIHLSFLFY